MLTSFNVFITSKFNLRLLNFSCSWYKMSELDLDDAIASILGDSDEGIAIYLNRFC